MSEHLVKLKKHMHFLREELQRFLPEASFAFRIKRQIGVALDYSLVGWPDSETIFSRMLPAETLFLWMVDGNGLEPEWFVDDDGQYRDDDGEVIVWPDKLTLTGLQQLAAYGLWLVTEEFNEIEHLLDEVPKYPLAYQASMEKELTEEIQECMLSAYQALSYAQRMLIDSSLTDEEKEKTKQVNFSALGKAGADRRHQAMRILKQWTINRYLEKTTWQSANHAAHELAESVIAHGKTIGANLSKANAQRTIAEWIRRSKQSSG